MNINVRLKISNPARQGDKFIEMKNLSQKFQTTGFQPVIGDIFDVKGYVTEEETKEIMEYGCSVSSIFYVESRLYDLSTQTINIVLKDRN